MAETKAKKTATSQQKTKSAAAKGSSTGARRGRPPGSKNQNSTPKLSAEEKARIKKEQEREQRINHIILAVVLIAISAFLIISIFSGLAGAVGRGIRYTVLGLFGFMGFVLPFYFLIYSIFLIANKENHKGKAGTILLMVGFFIVLSVTYSIATLEDMSQISFGWEWLKECFNEGTAGHGGGFIGSLIAFVLARLIGKGGALIVAIAGMIIMLVLTANRPFAWMYEKIMQFRAERSQEREDFYDDYDDYYDDDYGYEDEKQLHIKDMEELRAVADAAAAAQKEKNEKYSRKKKIINYLKEEEAAMFTQNDDMANVDLDDVGGNKKQKTEENEPVIEAADNSAQEEKSLGLGDADYLYSGQYGKKAKKIKRKMEKMKPEKALTGEEAQVEQIYQETGIFDFDTDMDSAERGHGGADKHENGVEFFESPIGGLAAEVAGGMAGAGGAVGALGTAGIGAGGAVGAALGTAGSGAAAAAASFGDSAVAGAKSAFKAAPEAAASGAAAGTASHKKERMDKSELKKGLDEIKSEMKNASGLTSSAQTDAKREIDYKLPPMELLKSNFSGARSNENLELSSKAALLEKTLQSFNVQAKVIKVSRGPAVTRFEVQPATGVKVNSIVRLQDDIALNLEARSIRMEAPIPGKAAVGIEIENEDKKSVFLREVIETPEFQRSASKITFAVGRDVSGNPIVANLKEMPHLLIAGSTGSGKSVCVNSIIMSLLYKAKPNEVKLIMVDPKVVELSNYNGIPHLLIPVVTEPTKAAVALNWAVKEMEDRYRKFQEANVRELASYNKKAANDPELEFMPQIVIIIDELADLMMAAPQQVEDAICRLAQKARAAGMHLIVATQRPSVDVITGVIKANIPSRIAFAVSSQIDSRTILDCSGAEKLVGKGDMLFNPLGMGKPLRVQGTFVSDDEVQSVIDFVSQQGHEQEFSSDLMDTIETSKMDYDEEEVDELLKDAIEFVVLQKQASTSMLQRKFRIGYNRAARMIDAMEERGIVGPADGSRPRRVFLSEEGLAELDEHLNSGYIAADADDEPVYENDEYNSDSHEPVHEPEAESEDV